MIHVGPNSSEAHQTSDLGFNNDTNSGMDPLGFGHIFFLTANSSALAAQTLHIPVRHNLPTRGNFSALLWKLLQTPHCLLYASVVVRSDMTFTSKRVCLYFLRFNFFHCALFFPIRFYHPRIQHYPLKLGNVCTSKACEIQIHSLNLLNHLIFPGSELTISLVFPSTIAPNITIRTFHSTRISNFPQRNFSSVSLFWLLDRI